MGTPLFAQKSLEGLLNSKHQIVGVFTQPDKPRGRGNKIAYSPVKELALQQDIPVYQPKTLKDPFVYEQIKELAPDIIVVVAYGQILPVQILEYPPYGCINVHASLLPKYRGAAPIHWAIINGEKVTGITTMYMAERLDAGDMILSKAIPVSPTTTVGELHDALADLGSELLLETLDYIEQGSTIRISQEESEATYASMLNHQHEIIDWFKSAEEIVNQVRGMNPWPVAHTWRNGQRLKIYLARRVDCNSETYQPGQIIALTNKGFVVQAGTGAVEILKVQPAGKKEMTAADYTRGYQVEIGEFLQQS